MSIFSRIANVFRGDRLSRDIDEEFEAHIEEAVRDGRDPEEARRAFGTMLRQHEASRDARLLVWLDCLHADAVFGWRQLWKRKSVSAAAILSLGLGIGSCTAAFRLIDALLWRPLPISHPERLYLVGHWGVDPAGNYRLGESSEYPLFRKLRAAAKDQGELIAVSYAERTDLTWRSDDEMERTFLQYVSGGIFGAFGIPPALGRMLTADDDVTPGAHPYAVLSWEYWTRRFGRDPAILGKRFRIGSGSYEVVGVAARGFTGTEPGTMVDVFVPTMMHAAVDRDGSSWFRALLLLNPGARTEPLRQKLHMVMRQQNEDRAKNWTAQSRHFLDRFLDQTLVLQPAPSGVSGIQRQYRVPLLVLGALVAMVLLIACSNVAILMTAQAAARAREMALRVSIGAGRLRVLQLMLVESAWLGALSAIAGGLFSAWAAPWLSGRINPPDNPARLLLPADWRVLAFGVALSFTVVLLFGMIPALRASSTKPVTALKGGAGSKSGGGFMRGAITVQIAFCFVVHFASVLFVETFENLTNQPIGFASERLLILGTRASSPGQPPEAWNSTIAHLASIPGVEKAALAEWPLLNGSGRNGFIWIDNTPTGVLGYFLGVSPGWRDTMNIPLLAGRDLREGEAFPMRGPATGVALVNEAFVKQCLGGANPIGRWFEKETGDGRTRNRFQIVGVTGNARYRDIREPITPTAYVPPFYKSAKGDWLWNGYGTFLVRTAVSDPLALAEPLRRELRRFQPAFRVARTETQIEVNLRQTVRERLLASLAVFFAGVALFLAAVGIFGVLNYSVLRKRREIGIRIAIGAKSRDIAWRTAGGVLAMVPAGVVAGLAIGSMSVRYVQSLLFGTQGSDWATFTLPAVIIGAATILAALPPVLRALRIDPVKMLRTE